MRLLLRDVTDHDGPGRLSKVKASVTRVVYTAWEMKIVWRVSSVLQECNTILSITNQLKGDPRTHHSRPIYVGRLIVQTMSKNRQYRPSPSGTWNPYGCDRSTCTSVSLRSHTTCETIRDANQEGHATHTMFR